MGTKYIKVKTENIKKPMPRKQIYDKIVLYRKNVYITEKKNIMYSIEGPIK